MTFNTLVAVLSQRFHANIGTIGGTFAAGLRELEYGWETDSRNLEEKKYLDRHPALAFRA